METTAPPLPLEKTVADMALRASLGHAADQKNPLPFNDDTMLAAAQKYKQNYAVCHGTPGEPRTPISNLSDDTQFEIAGSSQVLGNYPPGKQDDCAVRADQTPIGLASVTSSRHVAIDPGVNRFPQHCGVYEVLIENSHIGQRHHKTIY